MSRSASAADRETCASASCDKAGTTHLDAYASSPQPQFALVPRTRSLHHNCRESDCELRVQSGTRIIELLVSFDSEVRIGRAARLGELRNRDTSWPPRRALHNIVPSVPIPKFAPVCGTLRC